MSFDEIFYKSIEIPLGTEFLFCGVKLLCKEKKQYTCRWCYFAKMSEQTDDCMENPLSCHWLQRYDKKDVYFKEIKK